MFTVKATLEKQLIEDLIVSAIEGGSNYWYRIENDTKGDYIKTAFGSGLAISEFKQTGDETVVGVLKPETMQKALDLMATQYSRAFSDLLHDAWDATTADIFLQLAIFEDVRYG